MGDLTSDTITPQINSCRIFPNPFYCKFTILNETNNFTIYVNIFHISGIIIKSILIPVNSKIDIRFCFRNISGENQ
jgi:hypothetical protein